MARSALGTALSLLLLTHIIQGNPESHVLLISYTSEEGNGGEGVIHRGFEMCIGCWCHKLPRYNALIFICLHPPADCGV